MGAVVGVASDTPLTVAEAFENIFGYVLLNDWSARHPGVGVPAVGPVPVESDGDHGVALGYDSSRARAVSCEYPEREVPLLPHLRDEGPMLYDIALEVALRPEGGAETVISRTNYREMYYSAAQQLAHHSACGCPMRVGDLLGSGTISGPDRENRGSLLELSWGGKEPIEVDSGSRRFIEDGDTLTLRGHAQGEGYRIGTKISDGRDLGDRALSSPESFWSSLWDYYGVIGSKGTRLSSLATT